MPKHVLGIDIGPGCVTAVRLAGTPKAYSCIAAVQRPLSPSVDPVEQTEAYLQALHELAQAQTQRADTIVTILPTHRAMLRNLTVPFKDSRRIYQVLKGGVLEEHLPVDSEALIADYQMLPFQQAGETPLLVAAMPQHDIAAHLGLLQEAGFEPTIIDLDAFALANAALFGNAAPGRGTIALVDINLARTLIVLLHQGSPVFARSTPNTSPSTETSLAGMASRLEKQLQHSLYACEHILQRPYEPEGLLLSGGWDNQLSGLAAALQDSMGVPTNLWQMDRHISGTGRVELPAIEQARYAIAFGAALRGLHRQSVGVNFRRDGFALHRDLQEVRGRLIGVGAMLLLIVCLGLFSVYLNGRVKTQQQTQLRQTIARMFGETLPGVRQVQPIAQMQGKIRELEERLRAFGGVTGAQLSGLQILREISARVPASITLDVDTLTITTATTDMSGTIASYDEVVKLQEALQASPFFPSVKITNTRTQDNKVAFKLSITTTTQDET